MRTAAREFCLGFAQAAWAAVQAIVVATVVLGTIAAVGYAARFGWELAG